MRNTAKTDGKSNIKSSIDALYKTKGWNAVVPMLGIPRTEEQYEYQCDCLEFLMLNTPDTEDNPYRPLIEMLGLSIEAYENEHHPIAESEPISILRFLMEEHGLTQEDLPEVGNQAKVSELLSGKRKLNLRQVKALSARFHVPVSVFIS